MKKNIFVLTFLVTLTMSFAQNGDFVNCPYDLQAKPYDVQNSFHNLNSNNIYVAFPYKSYLDSASWWSFKTIQSTFSELENIRKIDHETVNIVLRNCLVDSLLSKWDYNNIDSLELLLIILEKYQNYAEASPELSNFFNEVADSYGTFVANKLAEVAKIDKSLKATFRFNYVRQHCRCLMYAPNISLDNTEKTIKNLAEGNFSYLWNRFWNATSFIFKLFVFLPALLLLLIFFYGLSLIIHKHI